MDFSLLFLSIALGWLEAAALDHIKAHLA